MTEVLLERSYWNDFADIYLQREDVSFFTKNILVVDDDQDFALYVKKVLSDIEDLSVDLAIDHSAAWKYLNRKDYDMIVMDIAMPSVNGVDLAKSITEWYRKGFPIIFVSGNRERRVDLIRKKFNSNHVDFCPKPLDKNFFKLLVKRRINSW